jgi:hypothetical protein
LHVRRIIYAAPTINSSRTLSEGKAAMDAVSNFVQADELIEPTENAVTESTCCGVGIATARRRSPTLADECSASAIRVGIGESAVSPFT